MSMYTNNLHLEQKGTKYSYHDVQTDICLIVLFLSMYEKKQMCSLFICEGQKISYSGRPKPFPGFIRLAAERAVPSCIYI